MNAHKSEFKCLLVAWYRPDTLKKIEGIATEALCLEKVEKDKMLSQPFSQPSFSELEKTSTIAKNWF